MAQRTRRSTRIGSQGPHVDESDSDRDQEGLTEALAPQQEGPAAPQTTQSDQDQIANLLQHMQRMQADSQEHMMRVMQQQMDAFQQMIIGQQQSQRRSPEPFTVDSPQSMNSETGSTADSQTATTTHGGTRSNTNHPIPVTKADLQRMASEIGSDHHEQLGRQMHMTEKELSCNVSMSPKEQGILVSTLSAELQRTPSNVCDIFTTIVGAISDSSKADLKQAKGNLPSTLTTMLKEPAAVMHAMLGYEALLQHLGASLVMEFDSQDTPLLLQLVQQREIFSGSGNVVMSLKPYINRVLSGLADQRDLHTDTAGAKIVAADCESIQEEANLLIDSAILLGVRPSATHSKLDVVFRSKSRTSASYIELAAFTRAVQDFSLTVLREAIAKAYKEHQPATYQRFHALTKQVEIPGHHHLSGTRITGVHYLLRFSDVVLPILMELRNQQGTGRFHEARELSLVSLLNPRFGDKVKAHFNAFSAQVLGLAIEALIHHVRDEGVSTEIISNEILVFTLLRSIFEYQSAERRVHIRSILTEQVSYIEKTNALQVTVVNVQIFFDRQPHLAEVFEVKRVKALLQNDSANLRKLGEPHEGQSLLKAVAPFQGPDAIWPLYAAFASNWYPIVPYAPPAEAADGSSVMFLETVDATGVKNVRNAELQHSIKHITHDGIAKAQSTMNWFLHQVMTPLFDNTQYSLDDYVVKQHVALPAKDGSTPQFLQLIHLIKPFPRHWKKFYRDREEVLCAIRVQQQFAFLNPKLTQDIYKRYTYKNIDETLQEPKAANHSSQQDRSSQGQASRKHHKGGGKGRYNSNHSGNGNGDRRNRGGRGGGRGGHGGQQQDKPRVVGNSSQKSNGEVPTALFIAGIPGEFDKYGNSIVRRQYCGYIDQYGHVQSIQESGHLTDTHNKEDRPIEPRQRSVRLRNRTKQVRQKQRLDMFTPEVEQLIEDGIQLNKQAQQQETEKHETRLRTHLQSLFSPTRVLPSVGAAGSLYNHRILRPLSTGILEASLGLRPNTIPLVTQEGSIYGTVDTASATQPDGVQDTKSPANSIRKTPEASIGGGKFRAATMLQRIRTSTNQALGHNTTSMKLRRSLLKSKARFRRCAREPTHASTIDSNIRSNCPPRGDFDPTSIPAASELACAITENNDALDALFSFAQDSSVTLSGLPKESQDILVDSGASRNIFTDPSLFRTLRDTDEKIATAGGNTVKCTGIGEVVFRITSPQEGVRPLKVIIQDALLVPQCPVNIVSTGYFKEHGCTVVFEQVDNEDRSGVRAFGDFFPFHYWRKLPYLRARFNPTRVSQSRENNLFTVSGLNTNDTFFADLLSAQPTSDKDSNSDSNVESNTKNRLHMRFSNSSDYKLPHEIFRVTKARLSQRLAFLHPDRVSKLCKQDSTQAPDKGTVTDDDRGPRAEAAARRRPTPKTSSSPRATRPYHTICSDVAVMDTPTFNGERYAIGFTDEYTRMSAVYLMRHKSQALEKFKKFIVDMQTACRRHGVPDSHTKIVKFRSDLGGEFVNKRFKSYLRKLRITHKPTDRDTPMDNGLAERLNGVLAHMANMALAGADLTLPFWGHALQYANWVRNRVPQEVLKGKSPYQMLTGKIPSLGMARVFGCDAYVLNEDSSKFGAHATKMLFLGIDKTNSKWKCMDLETRQIQYRKHVAFDEDVRSRRNLLRMYDEQHSERDAPYATPLLKSHNDPDQVIRDVAVRRLFTPAEQLKTKESQSGHDLAVRTGTSDEDPTSADLLPEGLREVAQRDIIQMEQDGSPDLVVNGQGGFGQPAGPLSDNELSDARAREELESSASWQIRPVRLKAPGYKQDFTEADRKFLDKARSDRFTIKYQQTNPKRAGTASARRYARYKSARTVTEALRLGASLDDIKWDYGRGYIHFPGRETSSSACYFSAPHVVNPPTTPQAHELPDNCITEQQAIDSCLVETDSAFQRYLDSLPSPDDPDFMDTALSTVKFAARAMYEVFYSGAIDFDPNDPIPKSEHKLRGHPRYAQWVEAIQKEYHGLVSSGTVEWMTLTEARRRYPNLDIKPLSGKYVFKVKFVDGVPVKYKARYVLRGDLAVPGLHYDDVFAPTTSYDSVRILLSMAAAERMEIHQADISQAFLQAPISKTVFIKEPLVPGVNDKEWHQGNRKVGLLHRALYGLPSSPREWYLTYSQWMKSQGFKPLIADSCVFVKDVKGRKIYTSVFVDDVLVCTKHPELREEFFKALAARFPVNLDETGKAEWLLGIKIVQRSDGSISLTQTDMIQKLAEHCGIDKERRYHSPVPMKTQQIPKLDKPEVNEAECVNGKGYRSIVGSLLFISLTTRPDISLAVGILARHSNTPGHEHVKAVKQLVGYLYRTRDLGITYKPQPESTSCKPRVTKGALFNKHAYADSDHAGAYDRKSTSGFVIMLNGGPVSWNSRKQSVTALSTAEAECYAAELCIKDVIHVRNFLSELGYASVTKSPTIIYEDNEPLIHQSKNVGSTKTAKHYRLRLEFIREQSSNKVIRLAKVPTKCQVADIFTKPLPKDQFTSLRDQLLGNAPTFHNTNGKC